MKTGLFLIHEDMTNVRWKNSETRELLLDLLHLAGSFLTSAGKVPSHAEVDRRAYERMCRAWERKAAWQALQRLRKQKLVAVKELGDHIRVEFTEKGKLEALKLHIHARRQELPSGEWCLVSFDIPEVTRESRDVVRDFLKQEGFEKIHHSLWRSRRDLIVPLKELVSRLRADRWIRIFCAREE